MTGYETSSNSESQYLVNLSSCVSLLTLDTTQQFEASDMLCARDAKKFEPHGRQCTEAHPGQKHSKKAPTQVSNGYGATSGGPLLVRALRNFTITEQNGRESWKLRQSSLTSEACDEELYLNGCVVVWSRGSLLSTGAVQVLRCFTVDSPVAEALWCNFLLPVDREVSARNVLPESSGGVNAVVQSGICIVESGCISVFTADGRDYIAALPFLVKKTWPIKNGLLFERKVVVSKSDFAKTPKKEQSQSKLPTLFSLRHPLDEMAPVICKTGGNTNTAKVSFITEVTQDVIYTSEDPPLVVTYDRQLSVHSIWMYRQVKVEEVDTACGGATDAFLSSLRDVGAVGSNLTPGHLMAVPGSHSASQLSRLTTFSSHSPSGVESPMRSHTSHLNSPSMMNVSAMNSPSRSRFAAHSRSLSPSLSLYRLNPTPSPHFKASPSGFAFQSPGYSMSTPADHTAFTDFGGPLAPEICLDHVWTEAGTLTRDGILGAASKAFQTVDFSGQQYFCFLVTFRHHLRCIKFEMSNDQSQLIFGSMSVIQARDAVPLVKLQMMAVLEMNHTVVLYSGTVKVNVLHISGLPSVSMMMSMERSSPKCNTPGFHPTTSSRPQSALDARFDDEVHLLSPVPTEFNESSQLIDSSVVDEPSFQQFGCTGGVITSLRDEVDNRFTVVLADGTCYRVSLSELTSSLIVSSCLAALRQTLPRDAAMLVFCRWYCQRNLPGAGTNSQLEWRQFVSCLLGIIGYDSVGALRPITAASESHVGNVSPSLQSKKPRLLDHGTDKDWEYLLSSDHHRLFNETHRSTLPLDIDASRERHSCATATTCTIDTSAELFTHIATVLYALHLVYEEIRLDIILQNSLSELGTMLFFLARDIGCDLYVDHYCRDTPKLFVIGSQVCKANLTRDDLQRIHYPTFFSPVPPNIYQWICNYLRRQEGLPFPCIPLVSLRTERVITMYVLTFDKELGITDVSLTRFLRRISAVGRRVSDTGLVSAISATASTSGLSSEAERLICCSCEQDDKIMKNLVFGVAIPMQEAIFQCRSKPPTGWGETAYSLIGRNDLANQCRLDLTSVGVMPQSSIPLMTERDRDAAGDGLKKNGKDEDDGMSNLDEELLCLRFSKDLRVKEVKRLLQSSRPVRIAIVQRPEISDHEFIEEQERYLYSKCTRTMALPVGRGIFTLRTYQPVPTEAIAIPKLCLTGRAPPRNTTVDLTHIETPANMNYWPQFHNGVAAGLKVANMSQLESSWIVFNKGKTETLCNEHAGFLMGQGLNGHLAAMNSLNVHDYLIRGHEMTSVGILLGLAANKRGTMDMTTTKMLSIHVAALLPPTSTELDVPHSVQVAAVLGIGLVYQGTAHRHIAEVLLSEIGRPPGPEGENSVDRESYSLAAGLALGIVMLGVCVFKFDFLVKGCDAVGLSDMAMPDQLYLYMVGGQKRPLSSSLRERYKSPSCQIKEGECVNIDVTSAGATLALGLMFFNTNNSSIAEWFAVPETQSLLDFVRPDFLLLRTLSRGLIMWNSIKPSEAWVNSNLPEIVSYYAFNKTKHQTEPDCDIDFETMSQAYCNIVTGACMAIGLKYAGSANPDAFTCLYDTIKRVLRLVTKQGLVEQAGKMTVESCLVVIALCLAIVMAGTGDLRVLRLCRHLGSRVGGLYHGFVTYGSHMAISMAIGLLFLGGGKYTLSTRPESIAALLCAFYPKFPMHSNDNRYHLQAFRHLYVLACEKRIVIPRDVDSNQACYVELELIYKNQVSEVVMAPCLLPELHLLSAVQVKGVRYWPVEFKGDSNWETLQNLLKSTSCLYVKQRAGYLPYAVDPKGYHSILAQSLTAEQTRGKVLKSKDIQSFSSDPRILAFAEQFCTSNNSKEYELSQLLSQLVYEAVSQEKLEVLITKIALHQSVAEMDVICRPLDLWQLKLLIAFYERSSASSSQKRLLSTEFLVGLQSRVEAHIATWLQDCGAALSHYFVGTEPIDIGSNTARKLSAFLTWYSVPHPKALVQMGITGIGLPNFPALYTVLRPSGLPVGAILALCDALKVASLGS